MAVVALVIALTALISMAPVFGIRRLGIAGSSRSVTSRPSVAQRVAGSAQIAIAAGVGGAALAFIWHLGLLLSDRGYDPTDIQVIQIGGPNLGSLEHYISERQMRREAILSVPGVQAVAFGDGMPGQPPVNSIRLAQSSGSVTAVVVSIDHHYPAVLGLEIRGGEVPKEGDTNAVLVNEALARAIWGRSDVAGELLALPQADGSIDVAVSGVLADVPFGHPAENVPPAVFLPGGPRVVFALNGRFLVRTAASPVELRSSLDRLFENGRLDAPVGSVMRLRDQANELIVADRARSAMTIGAATLVVLLAAFGFYGVQRFLVMTGRREYAIRAALGAGPAALGRLVLFRGLVLGLPGLVLGALFAFAVAAWLRNDGFLSTAVAPSAVSVSISLGIAVLLLFGSAEPAQRMRSMKPATPLREE